MTTHRVRALLTLFVFMPRPVLLVQTITFELIEEQPIVFPVGSITEALDLEVDMSDELLSSLKYSFLPRDHPHSALFRVSGVMGEITSVEKIDREKVCGFSPVCVLKLELVVQSSVFQIFKKINVHIQVLDINDNAPQFPTKSIALEISESVSINSSFAVEGAIDRDVGKNSLQTYDILRADGMFDLDVKRNLDGGSVVNLVVNQPLDRERRDFYRIYIMAKDGGIPRKSSLLMVNITVTDVNDNTPTFTFTKYNVSVKEVVPIGHTVLTVSAKDLDSHENWRPFYRLSALQTEEASHFFSIDNTTGEIRVIARLSKIQGRKIVFVIECVDGDSPPLVGQSEVEIFVQDTENTKPVLNLNLLNQGTVSEWSRLETVVAHLAVSDPDSGRNGYVKCSLSSSTFEIQSLDVNEYKIMLKRFIDRESETELQGMIMCRDEGNPPLNETQTFTMIITDENDNTPEFERDVYEISIEENNQPHVTLIQISALDRDQGENGQIYYSITNENAVGVNISQQGEITALVPFDREEGSTIVLNILAEDGGIPVNNATALVVINIRDVNDCTPTFTQSDYSFDVDENLPPGTVIGKVTARDLDEGDNGKLFLNVELLFENVESFPVTILQTGELKTTRKLDRESESRFEFVVLATDRGSEPMTGSAKIFINVVDMNDNSPVIIFPIAGNDTVLVPFGAAPGTSLAEIVAEDKDPGQNGDLYFMLLSTTRTEVKLESHASNDVTDDLFVLDYETGTLYLTREPGLGDLGVYAIDVTVRDRGLYPLSSNATLNVEIVASNETIYALLTGGRENRGSKTTIVTILGCLTGLVIVVVVVVIFTIRLIDRDRTSKRQRQLHVKIVPRDGDLKYERATTERTSGGKVRRSLSSPKLTGRVAHGWRFLSSWHIADGSKLASAHTWARNKSRKIMTENRESVTTTGSDSGKGGSDDDNFSTETSSLKDHANDQKVFNDDLSSPEPVYSVVMKDRDKSDYVQGMHLLSQADEIFLPADDITDYCSLDTISEEPDATAKDSKFTFKHPPVPTLRQPVKFPRRSGMNNECEGHMKVARQPRELPRAGSDSSDEETLKRASVDSVSLMCGDSVIFDLDLQKVEDIYV